MKTLDVHALHHAIDQTLEQLKKQSEEIANLKKSVDGITALDDALKGKGGDAIRAFYEECHTPFLRFYESFIEEYQSTLKKIKNALNSLEPNHNGYISQAFLDHDLEQGLNAADRTTKHLVSKANAAISKVSHIVDLPDLNDNDFYEQNRKAMKDINQTIEKLHTFDREQTNALKTAENDLETMQRYIARLEKMYTGPKIEIATYQKGSILKPDEIDALRGDQETAMGVMLDKLDKRSKLEKEISEVSEHDVQLYKLRKKLEKASDSEEYIKIAKEIGYDNLTPEEMEHVKSIEFWDDPLQATINNVKEAGQGLLDGVVDAGEKLDEAGEKYLGPVYKSVKGSAVAGYDLAKDFVDGGIQLGWNIGWTIDHLHKDPQVVLDTVLGYDYKGAFLSMVDTLAEKWDEKVVHGDAYSRAHYFTYLIGSLWGLRSGKSSVSTGSKDVAKAGKAAVSKAKKAGKTVKQSIKPPNNRYTPALQGILQDAPNSINVKNTPLVLKELGEDKKKSVLFKSVGGESSGKSANFIKKLHYDKDLPNHIQSVDPKVPRKRGIGGCHNKEEFLKNKVKILSEEKHLGLDGIETVKYQMASLDSKTGEVTGWKSKIYRKTIYDPKVISTEEFLKRGKEAAENAAKNGTLDREWTGVDSKGIKWRGYLNTDGEVKSFYPEMN
ncbi:T7SS effector LXG polymorphic toxin [Bacillus glycinifermentans]|uniref:T7SS effector LXG polymorphic toxin n=1 Tax=Bacillus glycinifermentans TaxID=1664069 RepID=UPI002DBFDA9A|nr:T7SS effector LXG polymorphic toxin [Bacillus glycinifermentans]MEC3605679.1 T7SS effector LXG polymorphic toxin [Bacillus glycinifermentans]